MAQDGTTAGGSSYTIDNVTFPVGRSKLQSIFDAIRSTNIGNTAPDLVAGQFWIDNNTPSTTVWTLYFYDGTDNISFATIDTVNNTVNFLDSTFDLINDTTPQLGGDLASNGNDIIFADSDKAIFGAGSDLQIYHDGSNSYVDDELGFGILPYADLHKANSIENFDVDTFLGIKKKDDEPEDKKIKTAGGWEPIPGGKKGGRRRRAGKGWEYDYSENTLKNREEAVEPDEDMEKGGFRTVKVEVL